MSTFSGWWNSFKKNPQPKQITWVCGDEPVLVDEVVSLIRQAVNPDPINFMYLDADEHSPRTIWNELRQLPFGTDGKRFTIVTNASKLLTPLFTQYVKDRASFPRNYVVFVSDDPMLKRVETERGRGELAPELTFLKTRGSMIECRAFTSATAKYAVEWVKEKADIQGRVAVHLLNRATGDLRLVRDTLAKVSLFPGEVGISVVNDMLDARPDDTFLGALFSINRPDALAALKELPRDQYSKTLGLVDARLELAGLVHDLLVERKNPGEIARAAGNKSFLVPEMLPVAKHYDKARRLRIRQLLATIDGHAAESGIPDGSMEALVALW